MTLKKILPLAALAAIVLPGGQAFAAPKPKVRFAATTYAVAEHSPGYVDLTVTRQRRGKNASSAPSVSVNYKTSNATATAGSDYTAATGTVTFPACSGSPASTDPCVQQTIRIAISDDSNVEPVETFNVDLTPTGTQAVIVNPSRAVVSIVDNDSGSGGGGGASSQFQLAATSSDVSEGNTTEVVYILRNGDTSAGASVDYKTTDGSAVSTAGGDFTSIPTTTVSFGIGEILKSVPVTISDDGTAESTESFSFELSNPSAGTVLGSPSVQQINIIDNDSSAAFEFAEAGYSVAESGGELLVTVRATGALGNGGNGTSVNFATLDGTAMAGSDYEDASGELLFDPGDVSQTIAIPITDDSADESDETFGLELTGWDDATATIVDDDATPAAGGSDGGTTVVNNETTNVTNTTSTTTSGEQTVLGARQSVCGLELRYAKRQRLLKRRVLRLRALTAQECQIRVVTKIRQVRSKKRKRQAEIVRALRFRGKTTKLTLKPGEIQRVKVRFKKRVLKRIRKALRAHKRLVATVVVIERDSASQVTKKTLKIAIRR